MPVTSARQLMSLMLDGCHADDVVALVRKKTRPALTIEFCSLWTQRLLHGSDAEPRNCFVEIVSKHHDSANSLKPMRQFPSDQSRFLELFSAPRHGTAVKNVAIYVAANAPSDFERLLDTVRYAAGFRCDSKAESVAGKRRKDKFYVVRCELNDGKVASNIATEWVRRWVEKLPGSVCASKQHWRIDEIAYRFFRTPQNRWALEGYLCSSMAIKELERRFFRERYQAMCRDDGYTLDVLQEITRQQYESGMRDIRAKGCLLHDKDASIQFDGKTYLYRYRQAQDRDFTVLTPRRQTPSAESESDVDFMDMSPDQKKLN